MSSEEHDDRALDIAALRLELDEAVFRLLRVRVAAGKLGYDSRLLTPVIMTLEQFSRHILDRASDLHNGNGSRS